jgi:hypothetical protein
MELDSIPLKWEGLCCLNAEKWMFFLSEFCNHRLDRHRSRTFEEGLEEKRNLQSCRSTRPLPIVS